MHLFEPLLQFYFRAATKWTASGKSLVRLFKQENPELAEEWTAAFESLVKTGDSTAVETAAAKILEPYGGYLWNGFRSDAPAEWKEFDEGKILDELKSREPIFHHPEKFGKTKEDIENQICDEFWEVGASGNVYTKQDVIETLLERYNNPDYQDIWEAKGFELTKISSDNYLLTYSLVQDKTRATRRSTLWRKVGGNWKILYHQVYYLPGGHIDFQESASNALIREMKEETGFEAAIEKFLGIIEHAWNFPGDEVCCHTHEINLIYKLSITELKFGDKVSQKEEHVAFEWLPIDSLYGIDLRPLSLKSALSKWL